MTYTEQDVERVAEAIANELRTPSHAFTGGGTPMPPPVEGIHLRIARAALEAMERELYQSRYGGRDPGEDYDFAAGHFEVTDDVFEVVGGEPAPSLEDVLADDMLSSFSAYTTEDGWSATAHTVDKKMGRSGWCVTAGRAIRNAVAAAKEGSDEHP